MHSAQASEASRDTSEALPTYEVNKRKIIRHRLYFDYCIVYGLSGDRWLKRKDALGHSLRPPQPDKNTAAAEI
jgi:hypothetical protein